jgi:predicted small lipoprotein YifL
LEPALSRPHRAPVFIVLIGALALTLPLAACGRKGGLDPPPGGAVLDRGVVRTPVTGRGDTSQPKPVQPEYDEDGRPIPPPGQKKKFIGDWLID